MSVSMEFITELPMVQGYTGILVVMDHFSKYVFFVAKKIPCSVEKLQSCFSRT
jgi:hypothetical protein